MAQYDINLREYWRILKKRKFTVFLTAVLLGVFTIVFAILRAPTPLYTSVCSIKFEKDTAVEGLYARTLSWSGGDDIETQISLLKSYSVMRKVAEKLGKIPQSKADEDNTSPASKTAAVVEALQAKVKVSRETFTNIINIEVTDKNPVFAQRLAAEIAVNYKDVHTKAQNVRTTEALKYITQQLEDIREKLRASENEFNRFTQENQLVSIDLQSENLLSAAKDLRDELRKLNEAKADLAELLVKLERFIRDRSGSSDNFYSAYANKQYQDTNNSLVELSLKKDSLLKDYTARHPEVIAVQRKIEENARKMAIVLKLQINGIERKKKDLNQELVNVVRKTNELMEKKLEYDRLKRKVDSFNEMTALLERKNQEASIRKAEKPEEVTIVRPALLPTSPINSPKTAATGTMGVIIGLVLGMVLAFIVETFDTSLGAIEDVEETLGTQVLGVIPHGDEKLLHEGIKEKELKGDFTGSSLRRRMRLVAHFVPQSMLAESFRALRTNIQFRDVEKKIKSLAITSASPQEGKSTVSANLAITMAQAGMKTLLVESDLRKPSLSKAFGIEISPGLTDVLLGNYSWQDVVKTVTDIIVGKMDLDEVMATPGLDNLNIITSGTMPPNPSELIDSKRLVDFIEDVKNEYDMIIFDTPPVLSTADPAILGTKVDAVLFVYMVGSISKGLLKRATIQLTQVKCNILGVVLNGMKAEVSPDFHDFKYYKYYYSHTEEKDKGFFPRMFGKRSRDRGEIPFEKEGPVETVATEKGESKEKKSGIMRPILLFIALGFLVAGILWQTGILPFDTDLFKNKISGLNKKDVVSGDAPKQRVKSHEPSLSAIKPKPLTPETQAVEREMEKLEPLEEKVRQEIVEEASDTVVRPPPAFTGQAGENEKGIPEKQAQQSLDVPASPPVSLAEAPSPFSGPGKAVLQAADDIRYPFSLRTGSFRDLQKTEEAVAMLRKMGLSPYWSHVDLGEKGKWFRVFVGHFRTLEDAKEFEKTHGVPADRVLKTAYAVKVGESPSKKELEKVALDLERLGRSPYFIRTPQNGYRLLVGAFVTQEAADQLALQLKEAGVDCSAVLR